MAHKHNITNIYNIILSLFFFYINSKACQHTNTLLQLIIMALITRRELMVMIIYGWIIYTVVCAEWIKLTLLCLCPFAAGGLMAGFALTLCTGVSSFIHPASQSNLGAAAPVCSELNSGQLICHSCYSRFIYESHLSVTQMGILPPSLLHCYLYWLLCKMHCITYYNVLN